MPHSNFDEDSRESLEAKDSFEDTNSPVSDETVATLPPKRFAEKGDLEEGHSHEVPAAKPANESLLAWYHVLGSFFLFMNSWGVINSFGVYQTYYETDLLAGKESSSAISWVGSVQSFMLVFVGVVTGPLFDRGHFRSLIYTGSFLVVFGMMMLSICKEYWQIMLAQGIVVGIGSGMLFVPSVAILPMYFSSKRALAQGIAASGSSLGGVIYPIIFHRLQPSIGFGWATRVIGFVALVGFLTALGMKQKAVPPTARKLFDYSAFKEPAYVFFAFAFFFGFMGIYVPFYYIGLCALDKEISASLAFYLLAILNASSTFGRIIPNLIADRTGPLNMMLPMNAVCVVLVFAWMAISKAGGLIALAILYGFFSGCFVSLPPVVVVTMSPSMGVVGTRLGMNLAFAAMGLLIGNPIAGVILGNEKSGENWIGLIVWCGTCVTAATLCVLGARVLRVGWGIRKVA